MENKSHTMTFFFSLNVNSLTGLKEWDNILGISTPKMETALIMIIFTYSLFFLLFICSGTNY